MTELREEVRAEISNAIAEVYDAYNPIEKAVGEATDAIMALFAGGSGEVSDARQMTADGFEARFHKEPGTLDHIWTAMLSAIRKE